MPEKVDFKNMDAILENFDTFCDEFETKASNSFLRGDQNDGRVTAEAERVGDGAPEVVREIREPGPTDLPARETIIDVQTT
jgi:hypothetical protein